MSTLGGGSEQYDGILTMLKDRTHVGVPNSEIKTGMNIRTTNIYANEEPFRAFQHPLIQLPSVQDILSKNCPVEKNHLIIINHWKLLSH